MDTLRLDRIEVYNYRCFAHCDVRVHPNLTIFVAENARGKTAILDAIAMALGPVVDELSLTRQWSGIDVDDVRCIKADVGMRAQLPAEVVVSGVVDGARQNWSVSRASVKRGGRTVTKHLVELRKRAQAMRSRLDDFARSERELPPPLPLVAHYGTGRLWAEERLTAARRRRDATPLGRLSGYQDCLSSASSFKAFAAWFGDMVAAARSPTSVHAKSHERPEKLLSAVRKAAHVVLEPTGWTDLFWEFAAGSADSRSPSGHLVVTHEVQGCLPLSRLSDGVRNMLALVGDVAHRCARLNPEFGEDAARRTPGVLLIDEIDMHLHPGWQQLVVGLLQRAFPLLQLIVTTHSPQVLSSVHVESVRVIRLHDGLATFDEPQFQTRGVDSADVLAEIMGIDPVPGVAEAKNLSRYRAMIEDGHGESENARILRRILDNHFGTTHPVMLACDKLLRFQQFRVRRKREEGSS